MPEAKGKKLSAESLDALIFALGLSEPENAGGSVESNLDTDTIRPTSNRVVSSNHGRNLNSLAIFPGPRPSFTHGERYSMDAAEVLARDYLSDYDICSDFDENYKHGEPDFVPSRPESLLETFEIVDPYITGTRSFTQSPPLSPASSYSQADTICLKVAHNAAIIMLRVPYRISFVELRRRLYEKFVNQQKIFLSHTFSVLLALPPGSLNSSSPSPGYERVSFASRTEVRVISRESDWRNIVSANDGTKITLRILDTPM